VFQDRDDWIVFAPVSGYIFRTDQTTAERFGHFIDEGRPEHARQEQPEPEDSRFAPTDVTAYISNGCPQACHYCYGKPLHSNAARIDEGFFKAGVDLAAANAAEKSSILHVTFHGAGEPTLHWQLFQDCVTAARATAERHGVPSTLSLSTGGQLSPDQVAWTARNLDEISISLDGPRAIQNRQRPRKDGKNSLEQPLALARAVLADGKTPFVKVTVTNKSVDEMATMIKFFAQELGRVCVVFDMMFDVPWRSSDEFSPPHWAQFVDEFGRALDCGEKLGVEVQHAQVSVSAACAAEDSGPRQHFALVAPDVVAAFHDVFAELGETPVLGTYGGYCRETGSIWFDHQKRVSMESTPLEFACQACPCVHACHGTGAAKARIDITEPGKDDTCRMKVGVLKELLRRAVPRRTTLKEALT